MDKTFFLKRSKLKKEYENLFSSLNNLKLALKENKNEVALNLLDHFIASFNTYCEKEEKLMHDFKYPDLEYHKKEHILLKRKLEYFFFKKRKKEIDLSYEVIEILENLLIDHINRCDKAFHLYLTIKIDTITEFLSREAFLDTLQEIIKKKKKEISEEITLILLEIKDFPLIFFTLGSKISELLLKDFSVFLKNQFNSSNVIFGKNRENQLLIALLGYSFLEILNFLEELTDKVKTYRFKFKNQNISLTISMGVALYPQDGESALELLKSAEIALQVAKKEGKNNWVFFDTKFLKDLENINKIKNLLEFAIREHLVIPYIQPIFDANTRKVVGGEVLIRILDEKGNIVSAGTFIDYAYELGYIEELEALLTERITHKDFLEVFKGKYIFINKCVTSYDKARFLSEELKLWKDLAEKYEISCILEITESSIMEFLDIFQMISSETKTEKTGIAIDDFGSGYASFISLLKVDPKFLKIDGSLIQKITESKKSYIIVKGIISMARELNIKTIAEFVKDEKEAEILKGFGVDLFQSFYFSKPLPIEDFKKLVFA